LSFGAAVIFTVIGSFALETKDDRLKEVDPKLLFPLKAWLRGFLPGHKFTWDEENDLAVEDEMEMEVKIQLIERPNNLNHYTELVNPFVTRLVVSVFRTGAAHI